MKGWRRRDGRAGHRRAMAKGEDERASERLTLANTFQASSSLSSPFARMMRDMHAPFYIHSCRRRPRKRSAVSEKGIGDAAPRVRPASLPPPPSAPAPVVPVMDVDWQFWPATFRQKEKSGTLR